MYRLIQRNQKKLLAVFGVLLMVVFIIPPAAKYGNDRRNPVVAHIGKDPIYDNELRAAKDEWQTMSQIGMRSQQGPIPLTRYFLSPPLDGLAVAIDKNPELFLLLQKEAVRRGVAPDDAEAMTFVATNLGMDVSSQSPRVQEMVAGVRGMLLILGDVQQLAGAVKISDPVWRHQIAQDYQTVRLNLVEFRGEDQAAAIPAPTTQQVQEQFDRFRNELPGEANAGAAAGDPLGFGYKVPSRVKLQYVEIPAAQVLASVKGTGDKLYEWQVKAAEYYDAHQEEFRNPLPPATRPVSSQPSTQASTQASTQPTTQATTQSAGTQPTTGEAAATQVATPAPATQGASTAPTTLPATEPASQPAIKPLAEVRDQIIAKLAADEVSRRTAEIEKVVEERLASQWQEIRRTGADTRPATTPIVTVTTQPDAGPTTLGALEQLRADVQQKFGVDLGVHEIVNGWQTAEQLAALPGIGEATAADRQTFAGYAMSFARAGASSGTSLSVWEPSPPLTDAAQDAYVFRLTAAEPAHSPADVSAVAQQVTQDWRTAQAYARAEQAARKFLDNARTQGMAQAARSESLTVKTAQAGPFAFMPNVTGYDVKNPADRQALIDAAKKLLDQSSPADRHPVTLVALPGERTWLAVELAGTQLFFGDESMFQGRIVQREQLQRLGKLADAWFSYSAVTTRLDYHEDKS